MLAWFVWSTVQPGTRTAKYPCQAQHLAPAVRIPSVMLHNHPTKRHPINSLARNPMPTPSLPGHNQIEKPGAAILAHTHVAIKTVSYAPIPNINEFLLQLP